MIPLALNGRNLLTVHFIAYCFTSDGYEQPMGLNLDRLLIYGGSYLVGPIDTNFMPRGPFLDECRKVPLKKKKTGTLEVGTYSSIPLGTPPPYKHIMCAL